MRDVALSCARLLRWVLCMSCWAAWGPVQAFQIIDQRGVSVEFSQSPQRIVSLLPSLTEAICALDQCQRLVGVDRYSNFPAEVAKLPQLGGGLDPNIEAVVALKPDVVLLATSSRVTARLESLGLKVLALEPKRHADVHSVLVRLGQLLQIAPAQGAERAWSRIEAGMATAAQSLGPQARQHTVYFEVNRGPFAAGEASFIGETLARMGVRNIVPASMGPFPKLNPEYVVRANPGLIMIGNSSMAAMASYPGWHGIEAIRRQRICAFSREEADVLVRAGPRMAEAARLMAKCLNDKAGA